MKVKKLTIRNVGILEDIELELNQPLILFFGGVMQGKSTILNAVRWAFGGQYPADIIRHGTTEASVVLETDSGSICREWYVGKDGETKARDVVFIRDGKPVKRPVDEIKKFLNPFLLDQDHLRKMGETERTRYFVDLFGVDTSAIDKTLTTNESSARELRAKIKGYGDIDIAVVEKVDVGKLRMMLKGVKDDWNHACNVVELENESIREHNTDYAKTKSSRDETVREIQELTSKLAILKSSLKMIDADLINLANPIPEKPLPPPPTNMVADLEKQIDEGIAANVRHEQYLKNMERDKQRKQDQHALSTIETALRDLRESRAKKILEVNEHCPIRDLVFREDGAFEFEKTSAGMLSGSQIMRLSSQLSSLYPEGLGLDLIDRAESLGKSVFLFVERAQREKKSILATIVGEKPAKVPENVGVFVVENGKLK